MLTDGRGRPLAMSLTGGQEADCRQAACLLSGHLRPGRKVLADRAYDTNELHRLLQREGCRMVVPSKRGRILPRNHDKQAYKERNVIERLFRTMKENRAIATRYDKRAFTYFSTCCLIACLLWL